MPGAIKKEEMKYKLTQSGDTLVEVLLATVILSAVLAASYTLSNRASKLNQQAFERTQVSNLMQQQAELARAARDLPPVSGRTESAEWAAIEAQAQSSVPVLGTDCDNLSGLSGARTNGFHIDNDLSVDTSIDLVDGLFRIWAEVEQGVDDKFWDVHVFACWEGLGVEAVQKSSIVLRLGDPS